MSKGKIILSLDIKNFIGNWELEIRYLKTNMYKKTFFILFIFLAFPLISEASTFNPNNILSDSEYLDSSSMSSSYIQEFLNSKGSGLTNLNVDVNGTSKSVATIFYEAAKEHNVSQKLLVATAQKEQSAITDGDLSQNQLDKLMGYGIYPGNDYDEYLGVYNQINYSAMQFRRYYDLHENYNWQIGKSDITSDDVEVTPDNKATAGLYNYTPYAGADTGATLQDTGNGGNFLFWKTWNNWFVTYHPSGTLIREDGGVGIYYIQNGKKKPFWSKSVFEGGGFQEDLVVTVSKNEIDAYSTTSPMKYIDGTVVQGLDGGVFVIENGLKRAITSREIFDDLGYSVVNIIQVTDEELGLYERGENLETKGLYPNGTLVISPINGGIYIIENGHRKPVRDRMIFENRFTWDRIVNISITRFNKYKEGDPVLFKDGTLIRDEAGNIFVIEDGLRRHIARPSVFAGLGYNIGHVLNVPDWIVLMHMGGEAIQSY